MTPPGVAAAPAYDPLDAAFWADPWPTYRRLRDDDPVHRARVGPSDFFVLSRFDDVWWAATEPGLFSSAAGLTYAEDEIGTLGLAPTLVMMDRPAHTAHRRLVNAAFSPKAVVTLEPAVRRFAADALDRLTAGGGDAVAELAEPLPQLVVATYLGVPEADRARFAGWSAAIVRAAAAGSVLGAATAVGELYGYFSALIEEKRSWLAASGADPGLDLVAALTGAEVDGRPVTVEEILGFCFVMIAGGNDTAAGLLAGTLAALDAHPGQRARLEADPGLVPGAVEELLRWLTPVQGLSRTTTTAVERHGRTIPAGTKVHLLYASANHDERQFGPDAERLDVARRPARTLAFSQGPHHCLGAHAARLQGRVVLEELLARRPLGVDPAGARLAPGPFTRRHETLLVAPA